MLIMRKKQCGLLIVEVLIGLTLSTIIAVAALALFSTTITSSEQVLKKGKLDRDLYAAMDMMVADIQRAGRWNNATSSVANPFTTGPNDITVSSGNCVTFTYDTCTDGTQPTCPSPATGGTVPNGEKFGYRLNGSAIQFLSAAATPLSCASGTWTNLTDPNVIIITAFTVSITSVAVNPTSGTNTTNYRTVNISISAQLKNDSAVTKIITRSIKVYNNSYTP